MEAQTGRKPRRQSQKDGQRGRHRLRLTGANGTRQTDRTDRREDHAENKRIFDTAVQKLKYDVLKAIIPQRVRTLLREHLDGHPQGDLARPKATMRCCIFKERAIVQERIKLALGATRTTRTSSRSSTSPATNARSAASSFTPACRGCIVHRCQEVCPKGAIQIIEHRAVVDKTKCIECGKCTQACPVRRHHRAEAPLRRLLQGQGDQRRRGQEGGHRQQQVHRLRRVRLPVPVRRRRRQILRARMHRYPEKVGGKPQLPRLRGHRALHRQPVQVREDRTGRHPASASSASTRWSRRRWARTSPSITRRRNGRRRGS